MMRVRLILAVLLGVLLGAGLFRSSPSATAANNETPYGGTSQLQPTSEGYRLDQQRSIFRANLASVDSSNFAAVAALPAFGCFGRETITVTASFALQNPNTGAAAPAVGVQLWGVFTDVDGTKNLDAIAPVTTLTQSPGAGTDPGGKYLAPSAFFDSMGASHVYVQVVGFAGGVGGAGSPVSLRVGSY